jgi:DHA1 family bicyclomycin/chloramphenicol resistance-like MFS transporter
MLLFTLLAQISFGLIAMTICLPSMQEWGDVFGASQARVQLTFSGYVLAFGLFQLVYGPLSDRHGRRGVLLTGLALLGLGSLMAALAPNLDVLIAARVLQGAGSAAGTVVGRAMVQDQFQGSERTKVMAYIGMAMGLCPPVAAVIGGELHVRFGWQANFVLILVGALVMDLEQGKRRPALRQHQPPIAGPRTTRSCRWASTRCSSIRWPRPTA